MIEYWEYTRVKLTRVGCDPWSCTPYELASQAFTIYVEEGKEATETMDRIARAADTPDTEDDVRHDPHVEADGLVIPEGMNLLSTSMGVIP